MNICQRIVSQVGRRVDEGSPICDARLPDGSRVNVIVPPLSLDGPTLTIRKFRKDKLTMKNLVEYASISPEGARVLGVIGACRCNVIISGGTGSGKTTLLNTLTAFIDPTERVITCEDAAELQLQQPHVVRLEVGRVRRRCAAEFGVTPRRPTRPWKVAISGAMTSVSATGSMTRTVSLEVHAQPHRPHPLGENHAGAARAGLVGQWRRPPASARPAAPARPRPRRRRSARVTPSPPRTPAASTSQSERRNVPAPAGRRRNP